MLHTDIYCSMELRGCNMSHQPGLCYDHNA